MGYDYDPYDDFEEIDWIDLISDPYEDPYYGDVQWKKIKGHPNYEIGSNGQVRSWIKEEAHVMKTWPNQYGHQYLKINNDRVSVHRLVAEHFIPNPNNYSTVRHLNDNPRDNRVENLAWGTQADNVKDMRDHGRMFMKSVYCYETDRIYKSCAEAAYDLGVTRGAVTMCCQGKTHECCGFHLCYLKDREKKFSKDSDWLKPKSIYKPVKAINVETGEEIIFSSRKEAAAFLGIPDCGISSTITGKTPHSHGWKFEDWSDCS